MVQVGDKIKITKKRECEYTRHVTDGKIYSIVDVGSYFLSFRNDKGEKRSIWTTEEDFDFEYEVIKQSNPHYNCVEIGTNVIEFTNYKVEKHKIICEQLNKIYASKNHDYGDSFGETYKKLGIISAVTRITDKVNRLQSLCTKEQKVKDESIEDTLMDLANYALMTLIELKEGEKNEG